MYLNLLLVYSTVLVELLFVLFLLLQKGYLLYNRNVCVEHHFVDTDVFRLVVVRIVHAKIYHVVLNGKPRVADVPYIPGFYLGEELEYFKRSSESTPPALDPCGRYFLYCWRPLVTELRNCYSESTDRPSHLLEAVL